MNILGLSAFGQNPMACLLQNGKLVAFAEEERFIRIKTAYRKFPVHAISYCLKEGKVSIDDVSEIAFGWDFAKYSATIPLFSLQLWLRHIFLQKYNTSNRGIIKWLALLPSEVKSKYNFFCHNLD